MGFFFIRFLKLKFKYISNQLFFDLYKIYLKCYFNLFKGPTLSFSFYNTRIPLFFNNVTSRNIVSPFFVFILINRGLWYMFNFDFWLGSRILDIKPTINALRSNLQTKSFKYNRKNFFLRLLSYHILFLKRQYFFKLLIILLILEFIFIFNFFDIGFICLFYFILPIIYYFGLIVYSYFFRLLKIGIKKNLLKPVTKGSNIPDFMGSLNYTIFLNSSNYYFQIRNLLLSNYSKVVKKYNFLSKNLNMLIVLDKDNSNQFPILNPLFKELNKFWVFSNKNVKLLNNFFFNFTKRRLRYFTNSSFNFQFLNYFSLSNFFGLSILNYSQKIVESKSFFSFLWFFIRDNKLYILFFLSFCYLLNFYNFGYFLIGLFFCFIIYDYIIYKNYLKNILKYNSLHYNYISNADSFYNIQPHFNINNQLLHENFVNNGFSLSDYLLLLKIDLNISKFEIFLNDLVLEQEFFFKKKEFIYNFENLDLYTQYILNKYSVLLKNHFNNYNIEKFLTCSNTFENKLDKSLLNFKNKPIKYLFILKNSVNNYNNNLFLEANSLINKKIINESLNINQRYYYYTYGLKLLK